MSTRVLRSRHGPAVDVVRRPITLNRVEDIIKSLKDPKGASAIATQGRIQSEHPDMKAEQCKTLLRAVLLEGLDSGRLRRPPGSKARRGLVGRFLLGTSAGKLPAIPETESAELGHRRAVVAELCVEDKQEREDMNKRLDEVVAMQKRISENIAVMQERVVERGMQRLDLGKEEEMPLDNTCYRCGGRGHFARVCPSRGKWKLLVDLDRQLCFPEDILEVGVRGFAGTSLMRLCRDFQIKGKAQSQFVRSVAEEVEKSSFSICIRRKTRSWKSRDDCVGGRAETSTLSSRRPEARDLTDDPAQSPQGCWKARHLLAGQYLYVLVCNKMAQNLASPGTGRRAEKGLNFALYRSGSLPGAAMFGVHPGTFHTGENNPCDQSDLLENIDDPCDLSQLKDNINNLGDDTCALSWSDSYEVSSNSDHGAGGSSVSESSAQDECPLGPRKVLAYSHQPRWSDDKESQESKEDEGGRRLTQQLLQPCHNRRQIPGTYRLSVMQNGTGEMWRQKAGDSKTSNGAGVGTADR
ncbi:hypothetical protein Bbelb_048700 [Branchiostoma belcheri]|nr:hypothetical protein Bbelb_048700 [Branchiostoma belcheri]